jgi:hypothetical protein
MSIEDMRSEERDAIEEQSLIRAEMAEIEANLLSEHDELSTSTSTSASITPKGN